MKFQQAVIWTGLAAAGILSSPFAAADVVLNPPIAYAKDAGVHEKIRSDCHVEQLLEAAIAPYLAKAKKVAGTTGSGAAELKVEITHVMGVGGGAWTGPKAITVDATLSADGKVLRQGKVNRWTTGGMWGGFKGTCSILDRSAKAIGKDLARWIRDENYKLTAEAAPPSDAASAPADSKDD